MSAKLRVYEVARDLGLDNKAVVVIFKALGVDVRNQLSAVAPEQVDRIKRHLDKQRAEDIVEERVRFGVTKRRTIRATPPKAADPPPPRPPPPQPRVERSAPVAAPPPSAPRAAAAPVAEPAPQSAPRLVHAPPPIEMEPAPPPTAPPPPSEREIAAASAQAPPDRDPDLGAAPRPSQPPRTGVEVWEGRPGVSMEGHHTRAAPTPRRVQYDAKAGATPAGPRHQRGPVYGRFGRMARARGIGSMAPKKGGAPVTQERSDRKKKVRIEGSVNLQVLAGKMQLKATEVLMKLMGLGMMGVNINSTLDADTAKIVAGEFGWEVEDTAVSEEAQIEAAQGVEAEEDTERVPRAPVVTVMGHVDHGKTSLLDKIRKTNVVQGEAGGITQHIGAYSVETEHGRVCFLDTPGHEAFTAMRARGAQATDVVVLVVAADDGVMPQTREAANHAKAAGVPIVVAVNKVDKPEAQPDRVKRELSELALVPEEWGGETLFVNVSAVTGEGIEELLSQLALQAEMLELRANPTLPATGIVIEAKLDRGKGPVATVLITEGTLNRGDVMLAGMAYGKVRAMLDDRGRAITSAGPATPVAIIGLDAVPLAGDPVHVVTDAKKAQEIAESRKTKERSTLMPGQTKVSLEDLTKAMAEADRLELRVVVKADVQGSVEALSESLTRLSTEKVKVTVVHSAVGAITEGDVNLATASGAIIIGFNVRPAGKASSLAQKDGVEIRQYDIIYNVVDDIKAAMEGLLAPKLVDKELGKVEIRKVFRIAKVGNIAGCMVTEGLMRRNANLRLVRDSVVIWNGKASSLKRFKDDAREVKEGFECGITFEAFNDFKEGDIVECFEVEEVKQSL